MKKYLKDVTLLSYSTNPDRMDGTISALQKCCEELDFYEVKLICDKKPDNLPENIIWEYAPHINHIDDFNYYMFLELGKHVNSSHMLFVHDHAYILHPELWDDDWLQWDYCGAPWKVIENAYLTDNGKRIRVGNGGFSLRSRRLLFAPKELGLKLEQRQQFFNEDGNICVYQADKLSEYGIKYMPLEEACVFAYENDVEENESISKFFGFHRNMPVRGI